jgi:hypothetical protein
MLSVRNTRIKQVYLLLSNNGTTEPFGKQETDDETWAIQYGLRRKVRCPQWRSQDRKNHQNQRSKRHDNKSLRRDYSIQETIFPKESQNSRPVYQKNNLPIHVLILDMILILK